MDGEDVEQDYARALQNFQAACESDDPFHKGDGCNGVGEIYMEGLGIDKDSAKAIIFFGSACDSKSADGCITLGEIYEDGIGVKPDFKQAILYYGKACDARDAEACNFVGETYEKGTEVNGDKTLAGHYYRKACEGKDVAGCENKRRLYPDQVCPCFRVAEILAVCPRPDKDHTERYVSTNNGKALNMGCLATRNYSPGSIQFEIGFPEDSGGNQYPFCARQSVDVPPYRSGGIFPTISPEVYTACKGVLDEAAKKLGIQLVLE